MRGRKRLRKWREEPRYNLLALKQMIDRWYEIKMPPRKAWSLFQQSNAVADVSNGREWFVNPIVLSNNPTPSEALSFASCAAAIRALDNTPRVIISRYPKEITDAILESVR